MVTQFHTLLHFGTLFTTVQSPTASVAASIRTQGLSKSHFPALTERVYAVYTHIRSIAAGPVRAMLLLDPMFMGFCAQ